MSAVPRVSIVLAVHDQARWLPATIASVQAQTCPDWELLLVNDGSTDDTAAIAARAATDPRIRYLPGPRRERCAARNRGIAAASAPLIAFLDGDDLWHPDKLVRQLQALDAHPEAVLCYTIARYVDPAGRPLPIRRPPAPVSGDVLPRLARANIMILASVIVRRAVLDIVGGFDEAMPTVGCEDWDLWLRVARRGPVVIVPEELTFYRVHPANTAREQILASGLYVLEKLYADPLSARLTRIGHRTARARLLWYHAGAAAGTSRSDACRLAARALRAAPASLLSRPAAGALATLVTGRGARS